MHFFFAFTFLIFFCKNDARVFFLRTQHVISNFVFIFELAPKFSNRFFMGCTVKSGETADAIVFGVKYCSRRDRSPPCHSTIFSRKPRKTRFYGHFFQNFRPPVTPQICVFTKNAPVKRCSVTVKLQSLFCRFSISENLSRGGIVFF